LFAGKHLPGFSGLPGDEQDGKDRPVNRRDAVLAAGPEIANRRSSLHRRNAPRGTSPDAGPDKNIANHGLPVCDAASRAATRRPRRDARAGVFFVSSVLSA